MSLEFYVKNWNLEPSHEIARTSTSVVFQVIFEGKPAVLKLLTPLGEKDEANGAKALTFFDGNGAVRVLKSDKRAQLLSFAKGNFLRSLSISNQDPEATLVACDVIKKLHAKRSSIVPDLRSLTDLFSEFLRYAKSGQDELFIDGAAITTLLLETETDQVVLHGDLHHKNIIGSWELGWLAIDPKGYFGERTFDLANFFYNPDDVPSLIETSERVTKMANIFSKELGIPTDRILKFAFAFGCLSAFWSIEDKQNPASRLRIARIIRDLL